MKLTRIVLKLNIVFVLLFFCFLKYGFSQELNLAEKKSKPDCLSPALQINMPNFQQISSPQRLDSFLEFIVQFDEYDLFIKGLESLNGKEDDLLLEITNEYPRLNQVVNSLLLYEAEKKYPYWLLNHSREVLLMSYEMAKRMGFEGRQLAEFAIGARFHDIGKCLSNPRIINQNRALTEKEKIDILEHTYESYEILVSHGVDIKDILRVGLYHHENFDGSGYPENLRGEEIPLEARIVRVADSFSAILGNRPYPRVNGKSFQTAALEIKKRENSFYDPLVVNVFEKMLDQMQEEMSKVKYLNIYEQQNMNILMRDAASIENNWPLAKVACGMINPFSGEIEFKATNSLGVHRHAEVNLILDVLRENIAANKMPLYKRIALLKKLSRLEVMAYKVKLDESKEAGALLEDLALHSGSPFKNKIMFTTLRPCDHCLELFNRLGVKEVVFAEEHTDPDFISKSESRAENFRKDGMLIYKAVLSKDFQAEPNELFFRLCMIDEAEELGRIINQMFIRYLKDAITDKMRLEDIHNIVTRFSGFINQHTFGMSTSTDFEKISEAIRIMYYAAQGGTDFCNHPEGVVLLDTDISGDFLLSPRAAAMQFLMSSSSVDMSI